MRRKYIFYRIYLQAIQPVILFGVGNIAESQKGNLDKLYRFFLGTDQLEVFWLNEILLFGNNSMLPFSLLKHFQVFYVSRGHQIISNYKF